MYEIKTQEPNQSANDPREQVPQDCKESNGRHSTSKEAAQAGSKAPLTIKTYFPTLEAFKRHCRQDPKLTPTVQLIYRLLIEEANCNRWQENFLCLLETLEETTKMSRPTVVNARMVLKTKGYIDFWGKPTKYTVYSLVNNESNNELNNRRPPQTPQGNTRIQLNKTIKERNKRKKGVTPHDLHHRSANSPSPKPQSTDSTTTITSVEELRKQLAEL